MLKIVLNRFPSVSRLVLVADRGLLSLDNLDALSEIRLASGRPLEFILFSSFSVSEIPAN